jgi:hypothetical protein
LQQYSFGVSYCYCNFLSFPMVLWGLKYYITFQYGTYYHDVGGTRELQTGFGLDDWIY